MDRQNAVYSGNEILHGNEKEQTLDTCLSWMTHKNSMLGKIMQMQQITYLINSLIWNVQKRQTYRDSK